MASSIGEAASGDVVDVDDGCSAANVRYEGGNLEVPHCLLDMLVNAAAVRIESSAMTGITINRWRCCLVGGGGIIMVGVGYRSVLMFFWSLFFFWWLRLRACCRYRIVVW